MTQNERLYMKMRFSIQKLDDSKKEVKKKDRIAKKICASDRPLSSLAVRFDANNRSVWLTLNLTLNLTFVQIFRTFFRRKISLNLEKN